MAITIENYKEKLEQIYTLDNFKFAYMEDIVFPVGDTVLRYKDGGKYIRNLNGLNSEIFSALKINKYNFCKKAYGYQPRDGGCPEATDGDFLAIKRLINNIFEYIEANGFYKSVIKLNLENINTQIIKSKISKNVEDELPW